MKKKEIILPAKFQVLTMEEMIKTFGGEKDSRKDRRDFWFKILKRR